MSGACEFSDPSKYYFEYDHEFDPYDYDSHDKDECLQSCVEKSRSVSNAAGCYFKDGYQCIFLKTGTIVGSSGDSEIGSCWKFH